MDANQHEQIYHSGQKRSKIFVNNFIGGIGWGLGATVGLAAFLALTTFVLSKVNFVPIIGQFTSQVVQFVQDSGPQRIKK
ncbi:MAG: hypothetical protein A2782_02370 [Candidatus Blackburnbacteria bacterium RIFCSPHIGHO2_01_FULL_43_15b]|uniref:Uncharacterized protein n=1 Tax=Candidatus Blackburnbacteria bacterium RIFCSPHIGHO2_01_FULL_43_15b TaxID=1797513 RepID=A0A1G1UXV0_9BACT|nr:MAG: hypothetical protein A2782_02370 [Candidatus Blackburnbacteria bacterium RIFCSPHIGHO2_01_FULL_43_15b]